MIHRSPLLFWSLYFFIGCAFALFPHWAYAIPLALLLLFFKGRVAGLLILGLGWAFTLYKTPPFEQKPLVGQGVFVLSDIRPSQSPFAKSIALKGELETFESDGKHYFHLPCVIFQKSIPKTGEKWVLEGTFYKGMFKPKKKSPWIELVSSYNLIRWRYECKESLRTYFNQHVHNPKVAHFFSSMATGNVNDRLLNLEFQKVGLSHILAISGFHFALIAALVSFVFARLFPYRIANILLLITLTLYFLFLGSSPSILRAFIMIQLYIIGKLLYRRPDVLNLMGLSLFVELFLNPRVLSQIGFQLSFLATAGILLFHPHFQRLFLHLFPKRNYETLLKWPLLDQHAYLFASFLRNAFALSAAVTCATLPVQLFLFHTFSLISIPYNLIFSPFLALSLLLIPFSFVPPLLFINEKFTQWVLKMIATPPELLNFKLHVPPFSFPLLLTLLSITLLIGLTKRSSLS